MVETKALNCNERKPQQFMVISRGLQVKRSSARQKTG